MWHWSCMLAWSFYTKLCIKLAVSECSIVLGRLNLAFYFYIFDYLPEIWHANLSWLWLQTVAWIFLIFAQGLSYCLSKSQERGKIIARIWKSIKKSGAVFCWSTLLLSFCENRFCPSQFVKKLNSMKRGAFFWKFCVSKVIATVHTHKSGVIFHIFPRAFRQTKKSKAPHLKMTKTSSSGPSKNVSDLSWTLCRVPVFAGGLIQFSRPAPFVVCAGTCPWKDLRNSSMSWKCYVGEKGWVVSPVIPSASALQEGGEWLSLRHKGSNMKKRRNEEKKGKGDYRPPASKRERNCQTWTKRWLVTSQTRARREPDTQLDHP